MNFKKLYFLVKKFNQSEYFLNLKNLFLFCKKNCNFITYNQLFYFIPSCTFNDLNRIILILKKIKIKIYDNIPTKENYFLDFNFINKINIKNNFKVKNKFFFKNLYFKKIKNIKIVNNLKIEFIYYKIEKILKKISNIFLKDIIIIKYIFNINNKNIKTIVNNLIIRFYNVVLKFNELNIFKTTYSNPEELKKTNKYIKNKDINFFKKKHLKKIYKILTNPIKKVKTNYFFLINNFFNILYKNKFKNYKKKKKYKKIVKNILNNKLKDFKIDLIMLNYIYEILLKDIKIIENIKNKIYDILVNLSNISYLKFTFFFLKNGSNLNWVFNISDLSYFDKNLIKNFKLFIKKQKNILKKMENKNFLSIKKFIKIFSSLEIYKFKIDIMKENIINFNLNVVNLYVKKYHNKESYWDCVQEANIGIIEAVNNYNNNLNINFNDYINYYIKKYINNFLYKNDKLIYFPKNIIILIKKINKISRNYYYKYGLQPDINYICNNLKITQHKFKKILNFCKDPVSLENIINNDDNIRLIDYIENDENIDFNKFLNYSFNTNNKFTEY